PTCYRSCETPSITAHFVTGYSEWLSMNSYFTSDFSQSRPLLFLAFRSPFLVLHFQFSAFSKHLAAQPPWSYRLVRYRSFSIGKLKSTTLRLIKQTSLMSLTPFQKTI